MLRLSGITKRYEGRPVVNSLDLEIETATTYALIGPSGCGKSTLLRMMIGLIPADEGTIYFNGKPLDQWEIETVRHEFGYVIQSGGLFPHLTAEQNATLPAVYLKRPRQEIEQRLEWLRELTQLPGDCLKRYPAQLSGGQRQRVSLMRALMLDPQILLLDEPLGALDPMIRSDLQIRLREIFRSLGKSVVLVTHDVHEAAYFGDQVVLMRDGVIVQQGAAEELWNSPTDPFVSEFIRAQQIHLVGPGGGSA